MDATNTEDDGGGNAKVADLRDHAENGKAGGRSAVHIVRYCGAVGLEENPTTSCRANKDLKPLKDSASLKEAGRLPAGDERLLTI